MAKPCGQTQTAQSPSKRSAVCLHCSSVVIGCRSKINHSAPIETTSHRNIRRFLCQQFDLFLESLELFHRRDIMRLIFGLFCWFGASLVLKTVEAGTYDTSYIQAPCDNSGNREITLGANGYQRYGFIGADSDECYNPYFRDCRIRLSVSSGYYITMRFQWIAIDYTDVLLITEANDEHPFQGNITPPYSIYSTTNWMSLQFLTNANKSKCLGGFRLYYNSFHYGECSENEFRCSLGGRCIPNELVCDSYDNCGDWSDEMNGTCVGLSTTSTVTAVTPPESLNPIYDHSYIQEPCDSSGNRKFTLGAYGFKRYGYIEADVDGCYNPYTECRIRLSVSSGYYVAVKFRWIAIQSTDVLLIGEATKTHSISGYTAPLYPIDSTSNWMNLHFSTGTSSYCLAGFMLHYTSFHYGECSENEFRCSLDGRCIPNEVVCDSYDNCGDWSDEMNGTCVGLSTSTVTAVTPPESVNPVYDHGYIQAPCNNSREFTLGANGYQRYGFIEADVDGCYNPYSDCRIRLSVSSGYYITMRFQWIAITYPDVLTIAEEAQTHPIQGFVTPPYSIYSTTNWMSLEFVTSSYHSSCMGGFRLYYNSFHYGECSENEFRCSLDGRCIPNELVCDSYDNCGDWSDEWAVTCSGSELTTGAIVAISVTCALVGIAVFAFLIHCIHHRKHRRSSSSSSSSVERRRSNPAINVTEPLGFVEPIGPPKYIYAPPAYTNINSSTFYAGLYEDPDQIHPPPYQSTFTTAPYSSNNSESLTCDNDNTPRLNSHEDNSNNNSNGAGGSNSNDANHC